MGTFYDPVKKRPQPWVFAAFILVPIFLIVFGFIWGRSEVNKGPSEEEQKLSADEFLRNFKTE